MALLHPRNVRSEFPDYPFETLPSLWEWADVSWHNDTCPSFKRGFQLVWTDYPDPREREDFGGRRFILCRLDDEGCLPVDGATLIETDDWAEVLALLD
jgi:hypothetical protein